MDPMTIGALAGPVMQILPQFSNILGGLTGGLGKALGGLTGSLGGILGGLTGRRPAPAQAAGRLNIPTALLPVLRQQNPALYNQLSGMGLVPAAAVQATARAMAPAPAARPAAKQARPAARSGGGAEMLPLVLGAGLLAVLVLKK